MNSASLSRRDFLKTGTGGSAALIIGFHFPSSAFDDPAKAQEQKSPNPFNAWVRITPDDQVTLILRKSEMGPGLFPPLPMILGEGLYVDWKNVKVEQAATDPTIYDHG